jgi:type III pantothenate kinase
MDLLIDIGNTNLKWAQHEAGTLGEILAVRHHGGLPVDLHAAWESMETPEQILVGSVAGEALVNALDRTCRSRWGRQPRYARTEHCLHGVTIAYERPERLGVDRWLALIAAHRICEGPVIIVDAGTAVTYDLLLANGHHLGGLILPGIEMMRDSLLSGTFIPGFEPEDSSELWSADTATAIAGGSIQAPAALAERLYDRLTAEAGVSPEVLICGGDAERLLPAIGRPVRLVPDLVLQGLALLA